VIALDVIKNPIYDIFDRLAKSVYPKVGDNSSMSTTEEVSDFPYFSVKLLGYPTMRTDTEGNETHANVTIQTDSYADGAGALIKAYGIDDLAHQEMLNMGFRRTYGPTPMDNSQQSIKRVTSRYTRLLGNGEAL